MKGDVTSLSREADFFRAVVEAAPTAIIVVDAARRIVVVNRKTEELFGHARGTLAGATLELLVPQRYRARHPGYVADFHAQPVVRAMGVGRELHGLRADGAEFPVEIGLSPVEVDGVVYTLASVIDISARRRAEGFFRALVEAAPAAMIAVDSAGRIVEVNRRTEELFGHDRAVLVGAPLERLVPRRFQGAHPDFVARFMAEPEARPMGEGRELFALHADGHEFPVEIGLNPVETEEGHITLASVIDITRRRKSEVDQLRLATIVASSQDAIISKSLDGIILSWNAAAETLFGYCAEEAVGQSVSLILPEAKLDEERELLARVRAGEKVELFETQRVRKSGSEFEVSVSLSPLVDQFGRITGASSIVRDISESNRRDSELRRSNAELEQFAYVASHDLQEPLRMVANYVELLADRYRGQLDERADKYIHFASDGARRMQQLVTDLLAFSRVGSQGKPLIPIETGLVLSHVERALGATIRESGAIIERGALPPVLGDDVQLGQLFQNLIGNAIKFRAEAPPLIRIAAEREGRKWHFTVTDNGIGMDMRFADRIFQMFQRLNERGKYDGSGIGLAVAKRIVERHGGEIWAESALGRGTTFHFTLKSCPGEKAP